MRKLGTRIIQKGSDKKIKKNFFEIVSELSTTDKKSYKESSGTKHKKIISKKEIAKKIGISERAMRAYQMYFKDPKNKYSIKPSEKIMKKLRKVARSKKKKSTRTKGLIFPAQNTHTFKELVSEKSYKELKEAQKNKNFFGVLVRVNILFLHKNGNFNDWMTFVVNKNIITSRSELNDFITGGIRKKVRAKNSILGFEIIETVLDITLNEYEPNEKRKKANYTKQVRSGKKSKQNKK